MTRQTEISALLSEHGFETLFLGFPEPAFAYDLHGKFVEANQSFFDQLGFSRKQLLGKSFTASATVEESAAIADEFSAASAGEFRRYSCTQVRKDGTQYRAGVILLPFIQEGKTVAVLGFSRDIDDGTRFYDAQLRGETLRRTVGQMARFGAWSVQVPGNELYWSDEMYEILAFPKGKTPPLDRILDLYPEPDRTFINAAFELCGTDGVPFEQVRTIHDSTGARLEVRVLGEAVRDTDGMIIRVQGAMYDVTIRSKVEAAQRRVEERLASTMKTISDGILILDKDWVMTFVNPRAEVILKQSASKLAGTTICEAFPDILGTEFAIDCRKALADKKTIVTRGYYEPLDLWLDATSYPLEDGLAIYFRDVSEQETAKAAIASGERQLLAQATLLDVARDAIILRSLDNKVEYWNRAATDMYGWTSDEAMGKSTVDLLRSNAAVHAGATASTIRDGYWRGELEQLSRTGTRIIADCSWTLVRDEDDKPVTILAVNADITEKRKLEENNLRAQRMESLGTLAGGVAHDLNNVLTPILMSVQLLASSETDPGRNELLSTMEASVKRGAEMIRQVLSFARGVEGRRIEIDLGVLLSEFLAFSREALPANVVVTHEVELGLWHTLGDPTQLLQVLTNLINNARDAMPDGGKIVVGARNVVIDDEPSALRRDLNEPGNFVLIDVEDNGIGMPAEIVNRIFEPFFTTKGVGEGTGLGLATSVAIVRSHGGSIHVYSELGKGSRFQIHLPAILSARGTDLAPEIEEFVEHLPRGNGELILVVDDELVIRQITCQTLETYGYTTAVASNGAEAISFIESEAESVDLILTDMMMPIMDGATASAIIGATHPLIPIITMSGLIANSPSSAADSGDYDFLPKPFTTGQLLRVVRGALQARTKK